MILYAVIMFAMAALFAALSVQIFRGKTEMIHDYHQTKVQDKAAYGKAFGKALSIMAGTMALSGAVSLFGQRAMAWSVAVLFVGFILGIIAIVRVQKKYNGGFFG